MTEVISSFRHGLRDAGNCLRGTFQSLASPAVTEILCAAGPDFICLDGEHTSIRAEQLSNIIRAAECHRVPVLTRVPDGVPHLIAEALDAGAAGVLVPRISTAESAKAAVKAARFPPDGVRGVGPGRAAGYGYRIAELLNGPHPLIGVQVETEAALHCLPQIMETESLDFCMIGPGDLGVSLKASGSKLALPDAIDRIFEAAGAAGLPCGIFAGDRAAGDKVSDRAAFVILGSDAMMLSASAASTFR